MGQPNDPPVTEVYSVRSEFGSYELKEKLWILSPPHSTLGQGHMVVWKPLFRKGKNEKNNTAHSSWQHKILQVRHYKKAPYQELTRVPERISDYTESALWGHIPSFGVSCGSALCQVLPFLAVGCIFYEVYLY